MGRIWIPGGCGGGTDLDVITAGAGDILSGKVIVGPDGEPLTGTLALSGNAGAGDVLSGKSFYSTDPKSKTTGTMNQLPSRPGIIMVLERLRTHRPRWQEALTLRQMHSRRYPATVS